MPRSTTHWFDDAGAARLVEEESVRLEPGAKVEGTIVDAASGEPIAAAEVRAGSESEVPDAIADARGAFRFWVDRSTRELHVHVTAAGFVGTHVELALWNGVVIEPRSHTIALRSRNAGPTGSVEITVVDATGEPFEGAHVWLEAVEEPGAPAWSDDDTGDGATFDANADRRTNVRGRCVVAGVPLRRAYDVRASALGHAGGRSPVPMRLDAGQTPARADVVLGQVGSLVVKVLDPTAAPRAATWNSGRPPSPAPATASTPSSAWPAASTRAAAPRRSRHVPIHDDRSRGPRPPRDSRRVPRRRRIGGDSPRRREHAHAAPGQGRRDPRHGRGRRGTSGGRGRSRGTPGQGAAEAARRRFARWRSVEFLSGPSG